KDELIDLLIEYNQYILDFEDDFNSVILDRTPVCVMEFFDNEYQESKCDLDKTHYTSCIIQFIDDNTTLNVIIKSNDEVLDNEDEDIFFYGIDYNRILEAYKNKDIFENEWKIILIGEVWN
ncbi:MAG: hypothetical protein M0R03_23705, partial [Novosphingobium sp.]|nr:hypothetical protein [Novosphingobium sp.]